MKTDALPTYPDFASYPNHAAGHTLSSKGSCSCGRWELTGSREASLVKSHQFHTQMVKQPSFPVTQEEPHVSTFPESFIPMRDAFVKEALAHPAFKFLSKVEVIQSIENRIWSILGRRSNLKPDQYVRRDDATATA